MSTTDIATLGLRVESTQVEAAQRNLERMAQAGGLAESAASKLTRQFDSMLAPLRMAQHLLAGFTAALGLRELVQYADTWKLIEARLSLATRSTQALAHAQAELFAISQRTRADFEATATLFTRVAESANRAGRSQTEILRFTETISKGLKVSGATAEEAKNAVIQLGQALASGQLRGDEFNSLRENAAGLMQALADNIKGVDGNMGKLREFAEQGELTFDVIFNAALKASAGIEAKFSKLPATMSESFVVLKNEVMKAIGEMDKATGTTDAMAAAVIALSRNLDAVGAALAGVATAAVLGSLRTVVSLIGQATTATLAWTAALARNPFGLLAVGISSAVAALTYFRNELVEIGGQTARVRDVIGGAFDYARETATRALTAISTMVDQAFGPEAITRVGAFAQGVADVVLAGTRDNVNAFVATVKTIVDVFRIGFEEIGQGARQLVSGLAQSFDLLGQAVKAAAELNFGEAGRLAGQAMEVQIGGAGERIAVRLQGAVVENFGTDWWTAFMKNTLSGVAGLTDGMVAEIARRAAAHYQAQAQKSVWIDQENEDAGSAADVDEDAHISCEALTLIYEAMQ